VTSVTASSFESATRYGGSFRTKREAEIRREWIARELAALRIPGVRALARHPAPLTVATLAERWRASRLDVAPGTLQTYKVNLGRLLPRIGSLPLHELTPERVAALVVELVEWPMRPSSTTKGCCDGKPRIGNRIADLASFTWWSTRKSERGA